MKPIFALPASLALLSYTLAQIPDISSLIPQEEEHYGMHKFVSRPDIEPARWKIQIFDKDRLAPGYWFVSPYERNGYKLPGGSWIGPHIYDGDGELVWSGSHLFNRINVMDFKVQNVGGKEMLSMLYAVEGSAYILDKHYRVQDTIFTGETGVRFNMHDFHTIENGSKYLYLQRNVTHISQQRTLEELGFDGECHLTFPGFEERDVTTKDKLFTWDATDYIPLSDSTMDFAPAEDRCRGDWDYLHSNSIDKFPDGNYLLSTRHSDTVYKISKDDGSIIWRLHGWGGERSDFEMGNLNFSRQHHARFREQNETHTIISLFDNALGADHQPPSSSWTRALHIALREDTSPMTAEIIASYDHPKHSYAFRRGNYQILPNGNAFVGWSEQALQSEHAPDGTILMQAEFEAEKLGTYRAFKFPFVAEPDYPPAIHSAASTAEGTTTTLIHVSWNGATEVGKWQVYKSDASGKRAMEALTVSKSGFETAISINGYAKYVYVQALDKYDRPLNFGRTEVFETIVSDDIPESDLAAEDAWSHEELSSGPAWLIKIIRSSLASFLAGLAVGCVVFFLIVFALIRLLCGRRRNDVEGPAYHRIALADAADFDEARLNTLSPNKSYRRSLSEDAFRLEEDDGDDEDERKGE